VAPSVALLVDRPDAGASALARDIGLPHAMRLQRLCIQRTLSAAEEIGATPVVWFRPPDARAAMRQWIGGAVELRPQASGSLGTRLAATVAGAVLPAGWIVVPRISASIDADVLRQALVLLEDTPYVIGPASDGGIYLMCGRAPVFTALRALDSAGPGALEAMRAGLRDGYHHWGESVVLPPFEAARDARAARLLS